MIERNPRASTASHAIVPQIATNQRCLTIPGYENPKTSAMQALSEKWSQPGSNR
jgi:hypothetical protein